MCVCVFKQFFVDSQKDYGLKINVESSWKSIFFVAVVVFETRFP